jgi:hypothetical protein
MLSKDIFSRACLYILLVSLATLTLSCSNEADRSLRSSETEAILPTLGETPPVDLNGSPTSLPQLPSPDAESTVTSSQDTPAPYISVSPTSTPYFPTLLNENFLTGAANPCELPCWQHLRVGTSTLTDVQDTLSAILDADIQPATETTVLSDHFARNDSLFIVEEWQHPEEDFSVTTAFQFDAQTELLEQMYFDFFPSSRELNPNQVVQDLGEPDTVLMLAFTGQLKFHILYKLIYRSGMVWFYWTTLFTGVEENGQFNALSTVDFCPRWSGLRSVSITTPLDPSLNDLSPAQRTIVYDGLVPEITSSPEDILGVETEQFYRMLADESNPCLSIDVIEYTNSHS